MRSLILQTAARYLTPLLMLYSLFLFFEGHNAPGGGFVGGLVVASSAALSVLAFDARSLRRVLPVRPQQLIGIGLLFAALATIIGPLTGEAFFASKWVEFHLNGTTDIALGSPVLFDLGVYLVVIGVVLTIVITLVEEQ